jgi:hypothetical protein
MIDKGFMRIAIGLIVLVAISAVGVGVYLYFNFNSQSRLPLIVPQNANWFVQIQTKKLKEDYAGNKPIYYDSFYQIIAKASAFKECEDPATPGVGLFSDLILFETNKAKFLGLSVTSDSKLSVFLDSLKSKNKVHGKVDKGNYTYVKIVGSNLYIAYKYKAMVFMQPFDTTENVTNNEKIFAEVFSGRESKFIHAKAIQTLYDKNAHVIWYHKHYNQKNSKPIEMAHGFNLKDKDLNVISIIDSKMKVNASCADYTHINLLNAENLAYGSKAWESRLPALLEDKLANHSIKTQITSEVYLNSVFKTAYQYIKSFK